jgi:hypothetical protein
MSFVPHPVTSTYRIVKAKAFNEDIDESWIDWSLAMIEAGYESDNLYQLAGTTQPYNQFVLQELAGKVLRDLHLDYSNQKAVLNHYVYFLLSEAVHRPETYLSTLRELYDICVQVDMSVEYMDFYNLYLAKVDLMEDEMQWYWKGANRQNIDRIIEQRFQEWLREFKEE